MTKITHPPSGDALDLERVPLRTFAERAYLDYSMYVINDRALPHVGDGLKPVQRRLVYGMSQLGLGSGAKPVKSARTVGDVLGKFHPHGDTACYEAMVLMAQPFSFRYPLIDGQGNWGAPDDPKSFAAMRYTEARLSKFAELLLSELGQGTVDYAANFDGTLEEPITLPARLPLVLANGGTGIAVGMATSIPPHNLRELAEAAIYLIDHPRATTRELMSPRISRTPGQQSLPMLEETGSADTSPRASAASDAASAPCGPPIFQGPDFPTDACIITPREQIIKAYETGRGTVTSRARWRQERKTGEILIEALPWQVSPSRIMERIGMEMDRKTLPMIADIRDESDHEHPTRLVILPKSKRVDAERLMSHLFAETDLETSHTLNFNVLGLDGKPHVFGLVELIEEWLEYRRTTVRRRLEHRMEAIEARLHLLEGFLLVYLNLDEVIRIIREADDPKRALIRAFKFTEVQVNAVLEVRLRQLAHLEEEKILAEKAALMEEWEQLDAVLASAKRFKKLLKKEIAEDAETYGDARRCPFMQAGEAKSFQAEELLVREPVTVVLSKQGWARIAKGHELDPRSLSYKSGDTYLDSARGTSTDLLVFIDSAGRFYSLPSHSLASARGQGAPLTGRLTPAPGVHFTGLALGDASQRLLCTLSIGYGFVTTLGDCTSRLAVGKAGLHIGKGEVLKPCQVTSGEELLVALATTSGYLLVIDLGQVPTQAKGKGVKLISIPAAAWSAGERMLAPVVLPRDGKLLVHTERSYTRLRGDGLLHHFGERARRGIKVSKNFRKIRRLEVE